MLSSCRLGDASYAGADHGTVEDLVSLAAHGVGAESLQPVEDLPDEEADGEQTVKEVPPLRVHSNTVLSKPLVELLDRVE